MSSIREFRDVISYWPSAADFGRDIAVSDISARAMKRRNRIPSKYWRKVVQVAEQKGFAGITIEILGKLAAQPAPPGILKSKHQRSKGS